MSSPKILIFSGSTRVGSVNTRLADAASAVLREKGADVTDLNLENYPLPIFNGDMEQPENAVTLAELFAQQDGFVIVSPEYNASVTPLIKNTLDWISTVKIGDASSFGPMKNKPCLIAAASPGGLGGIRGLYHLRAILMNLSAQVLTEQVALPAAGSAFNEDGSLANERSANLLNEATSALIKAAQ